MQINHVLIELLRAGVLDRAPQIPSDTAIDWDLLMDKASSHGVLAWVWDGICKLPKGQQPPRLQSINWGLSAQEIWDRYALQRQVLGDMVEVCKKNNMRLLLLKGIGLSDLYPKPESRPSGDIDIYLFGDYDKGNALFAKNGFSETGLHSEFAFQGVNVENHKTIVYPNTKVKRNVSRYLLDSVEEAKVSDEGYYQFGPIQNLPYLLMHALNHVYYGGEDAILPLRQIVDLAVFLNSSRNVLPAEEVKTLMNKLGLSKSFDLIIYLSEGLLNVDLSSYHNGMVLESDRIYIQHLLLDNLLSEPLDNDRCVFIRSCMLWKNAFYLCRIAKYIPHKPSFGLLQSMSRRQMSMFIKS